MSIIERAINKLDGKDVVDEGERTEDHDVSKKQNIGPVETTIEPVTKVKTVESSEPPPSTTADPKSDVGSRASSGIEGRKKSAAPEIVRIDLERLAAAGFLSFDGTNSRQDEDYQKIKRRVLANTVPGVSSSDKPANLIMITSSVPGEGKTFTSVNMALSLTREVDHTILAVDTDIVKRDMSRMFGALDRRGLYDVLNDPNLPLADVMYRTNIPNLVILPAGLNQAVRTEVLASARMRAITEELSTRYSDRLVIFDTSPILATSTAMALAPQVGQFILVVEANKTKHETLSAALNLIDDTPVTGLILNKSKQQTRNTYDYYGYYTKGSDS